MRTTAWFLGVGLTSLIGCAAPSLEQHVEDLEEVEEVEATPPADPPAPVTSAPPALTKTAQADGTVLWSLGRYEVVVDKRDATVPAALVDDVMDVYFRVYGTMAQRFDPNAPRRIRLTFDPSYDGAAFVSGEAMTISSAYIKSHPLDLDVVTHEAFHLVQSYAAYGQARCPSWAVEGFADYARYRYGVANATGGWSLPDVTPSQTPKDSYRVTGRFLVWLENRVQPTILTELHKVLEAGTYSDTFWSRQTTKSLTQLWADYEKDPDLEP